MSDLDRNPQAEQMADESMIRNLAAQAEAIWPQERELFLRYDLARPDARILDVACGTGEITLRLAELFPEARIVGVDLHEPHLELARERAAERGLDGRIEFATGDAYALEAADGSYDLVVNRHLLQAVPDIHVILAELARVVRSGGWLHVVAEDYAMMHFAPTGDIDCDDFWRRGPVTFAERTGTDLRSGRRVPGEMVSLGLTDVRVDYVVIDTLRVPRETFAAIWEAWRDGYAEAIGRETEVSEAQARAAFDAMIGAIRSSEGYGVWQLPAISAKAK